MISSISEKINTFEVFLLIKRYLGLINGAMRILDAKKKEMLV